MNTVYLIERVTNTASMCNVETLQDVYFNHQVALAVVQDLNRGGHAALTGVSYHVCTFVNSETNSQSDHKDCELCRHAADRQAEPLQAELDAEYAADPDWYMHNEVATPEEIAAANERADAQIAQRRVQRKLLRSRARGSVK